MMKRDQCIEVVITTPKGETCEALMEVKDHGHDLRFFHPKTLNMFPSKQIDKWELKKMTKNEAAIKATKDVVGICTRNELAENRSWFTDGWTQGQEAFYKAVEKNKWSVKDQKGEFCEVVRLSSLKAYLEGQK